MKFSRISRGRLTFLKRFRSMIRPCMFIKKMKTNEETSLEVLKDLLPILEKQEDYSNDALFATLKEYVSEKDTKRLCHVAGQDSGFRQAEYAGWRHGNHGSARKRRIS